jgi:hypothetical protein
MGRLWRDYNLSIVLFVLFLASWLGQTVTGWFEFVAEQREHGQAAEVFGPDGYLWPWAQATLENWQSEFLQLLTFVILTAYLIHKGSHESKDSDDRMQAQLDRIERRLEELTRGEAGDGRAPVPAGFTADAAARPTGLRVTKND